MLLNYSNTLSTIPHVRNEPKNDKTNRVFEISFEKMMMMIDVPRKGGKVSVVLAPKLLRY